MFDYIQAECPLPDLPDPSGVEFQTKDTPAQYLETYRIDATGLLWRQTYDIVDRSDPNAKGIDALIGAMSRENVTWHPMTDFSGAIEFYSTNICGGRPDETHGYVWMTTNDEPFTAYNYVAVVVDGQCVRIVGGQEKEPSYRIVSRQEFYGDGAQ
jgi:hypothetical protein